MAKTKRKYANGGTVSSVEEIDTTVLDATDLMVFNSLQTDQEKVNFFNKRMADLGEIDTDSDSGEKEDKTSAIGGALSGLVDKGTEIVEEGTNKVSVAGRTAGSALKGAITGSKLGPAGTVIGGVVGLGAGLVSASKAKKENKEAQSSALTSSIIGGEKIEDFKLDRNDFAEIQETKKKKTKEVLGFKHGGEVKGAGTAKSDSIDADVDAGSFIVPAENAEEAEALRAEFFPKTLGKKANLSKGSEDIKLSDGEHMFTAEEAKILRENGIDLDLLAPNADENSKGKKNGGGVKSKLDSDAKTKVDLENTNEKTKQKVKIKFDELDELSAEIPEMEAKLQELTAKGNPTDPEVISLKNDIARRKEIVDEIKTSLKEDAKFINPNDPILKDIESRSADAVDNTKDPVKETVPVTERTSGSSTAKQSALTKEPAREGISIDRKPIEGSALAGSVASPLTTGDAGEFAPKETEETTTEKTEETKEKLTLGEAASLSQIGIGLFGLATAGDRPEGSVAPELSALARQAEEEAGKGFSPEEKAAARESIESIRRGEIKDVVELSGGNSALALANISKANAKANRADLELRAKDEELKRMKRNESSALRLSVLREKQNQIAQSQALFDDNQSALGGLINAGIHNLIGTQQLKERERRVEERRDKFGLI